MTMTAPLHSPSQQRLRQIAEARRAEPPRRHGRQDSTRIEQRILPSLPLRDRIWQVHELNHETTIDLRLQRGWVANFHGGTLFQFDARLAPDGKEQARSDLA